MKNAHALKRPRAARANAAACSAPSGESHVVLDVQYCQNGTPRPLFPCDTCVARTCAGVFYKDFGLGSTALRVRVSTDGAPIAGFGGDAPTVAFVQSGCIDDAGASTHLVSTSFTDGAWELFVRPLCIGSSVQLKVVVAGEVLYTPTFEVRTKQTDWLYIRNLNLQEPITLDAVTALLRPFLPPRAAMNVQVAVSRAFPGDSLPAAFVRFANRSQAAVVYTRLYAHHDSTPVCERRALLVPVFIRSLTRVFQVDEKMQGVPCPSLPADIYLRQRVSGDDDAFTVEDSRLVFPRHVDCTYGYDLDCLEAITALPGCQSRWNTETCEPLLTWNEADGEFAVCRRLTNADADAVHLYLGMDMDILVDGDKSASDVAVHCSLVETGDEESEDYPWDSEDVEDLVYPLDGSSGDLDVATALPLPVLPILPILPAGWLADSIAQPDTSFCQLSSSDVLASCTLSFLDDWETPPMSPSFFSDAGDDGALFNLHAFAASVAV